MAKGSWQNYVSEVDGLQAGIRVLDKFGTSNLEKQKDFARAEAQDDYEYNTGCIENRDIPLYGERQKRAIVNWELRQKERLVAMIPDDGRRKRFEEDHQRRTAEFTLKLSSPQPKVFVASEEKEKEEAEWDLAPSWDPFDPASYCLSKEQINPMGDMSKHTYSFPNPIQQADEHLSAHVKHYVPLPRDVNHNAKKLPSANQWSSLQELRISSNVLFKKFLRLTSQSSSQGIKKLRRLYHGKAGILDAGIMSFKQTLGGREPKTLKDVFAFTWLSYIVSKLLQKHGRAQDTNVLADIGRWRLAIKKERDRLIYDEAVKIMWPESVTESSTPNGGSGPRNGGGGSGLPGGDAFHFESNDANESKPDVPFDTSPLSDGVSFKDDPYPNPSGKDGSMAEIIHPLMQHHAETMANEIESFGFQDGLVQLLEATNSNENLMFQDFLNVPSGLTAGDVDQDQLQSTWLNPMWLPPHEQSSGDLDSDKALHEFKDSPNITSRGLHSGFTHNEVLEPSHERTDTLCNNPADVSLQALEQTNMFLVVIEYLKYIGELTSLLSHLSGCGITDRRRELEIEDEDRPLHAVGEFINDTSSLIFGPLRREVGTQHAGLLAVIYLAETFVRLGNLQTVREVEEYIIKVSRLFIKSYNSFGQIVTQTLKQCLAAVEQMSWEHLYPGIDDEEEEYSVEYVERRQSDEQLWAALNLSFTVDNRFSNSSHPVDSKNVPTKQDLHPVTNQRPNKKRRQDEFPISTILTSRLVDFPIRISTPSSNPSSSSSISPADDGATEIFCPHSNCTKSFTGAYDDARVNLRRHVRTTHEPCAKLRCPNCGHESTRRDNLRKHFLTVHKGAELPAALACKARA